MNFKTIQLAASCLLFAGTLLSANPGLASRINNTTPIGTLKWSTQLGHGGSNYSMDNIVLSHKKRDIFLVCQTQKGYYAICNVAPDTGKSQTIDLPSKPYGLGGPGWLSLSPDDATISLKTLSDNVKVIYSINLTTKRVNWNTPINFCSLLPGPCPVDKHGTVYSVLFMNFLLKYCLVGLDPGATRQLWYHDQPGPITQSPTLLEDGSVAITYRDITPSGNKDICVEAIDPYGSLWNQQFSRSDGYMNIAKNGFICSLNFERGYSSNNTYSVDGYDQTTQLNYSLESKMTFYNDNNNIHCGIGNNLVYVPVAFKLSQYPYNDVPGLLALDKKTFKKKRDLPFFNRSDNYSIPEEDIVVGNDDTCYMIFEYDGKGYLESVTSDGVNKVLWIDPHPIVAFTVDDTNHAAYIFTSDGYLKAISIPSSA